MRLPCSFAAATLFAAHLLTGSLAAQQPPEIVHAQRSTETAAQGLAAALHRLLEQSATPLWVGYSVPVLEGYRSGWGQSRTTYLEAANGEGDWQTGGRESSSAVEQQRVVILFRLAGGKVDQVRMESPDRQIDAGGLRMVWLADVSPESSLGVLKQVAEDGTAKGRDHAVLLIALHRSPAAVPTLVALASPPQPPATRERAAFWLSNQRGHEGFLAIQKLDREAPDAHFRSRLTFDLTLSHDPAALDELIRMAHDDSSAEVRTQARFWMGTRGGERVASSLRSSADTDTDREARGQAVFALSRLPDGQAEPQLEQLAQTSKDPYVRQQAVFWLGQSKDPRALTYLTRLIQAPSTHP